MITSFFIFLWNPLTPFPVAKAEDFSGGITWTGGGRKRPTCLQVYLCGACLLAQSLGMSVRVSVSLGLFDMRQNDLRGQTCRLLRILASVAWKVRTSGTEGL